MKPRHPAPDYPKDEPSSREYKASEISPDLARLAELRPSLSEATRAAILSMGEGARQAAHAGHLREPNL